MRPILLRAYLDVRGASVHRLILSFLSWRQSRRVWSPRRGWLSPEDDDSDSETPSDVEIRAGINWPESEDDDDDDGDLYGLVCERFALICFIDFFCSEPQQPTRPRPRSGRMPAAAAAAAAFAPAVTPTPALAAAEDAQFPWAANPGCSLLLIDSYLSAGKYTPSSVGAHLKATKVAWTNVAVEMTTRMARHYPRVAPPALKAMQRRWEKLLQQDRVRTEFVLVLCALAGFCVTFVLEPHRITKARSRVLEFLAKCTSGWPAQADDESLEEYIIRACRGSSRCRFC